MWEKSLGCPNAQNLCINCWAECVWCIAAAILSVFFVDSQRSWSVWLPSVCCCIVRDPLEESAALASVELVHPTRVFSSNTPSLLLVHNTLNKCTLDGLPPPSSNQCIVNRDPSSSTPRPNIFQEKMVFNQTCPSSFLLRNFPTF